MNPEILNFVTHHWILFAALGLVIILLIIVELQQKKSGGFKLSLIDATTLINRQHAVLIDLRDKTAFNTGHIPRSINIEQDALLSQPEKYRKKPVLLIDQNGQQAPTVCQKLRQKGLTEVYTLANGLQTWTGAGLPLTKEQSAGKTKQAKEKIKLPLPALPAPLSQGKAENEL